MYERFPSLPSQTFVFDILNAPAILWQWLEKQDSYERLPIMHFTDRCIQKNQNDV